LVSGLKGWQRLGVWFRYIGSGQFGRHLHFLRRWHIIGRRLAHRRGGDRDRLGFRELVDQRDFGRRGADGGLVTRAGRIAFGAGVGATDALGGGRVRSNVRRLCWLGGLRQDESQEP